MELIILGNFWFWIFIGLISLAMIWGIESDSGATTTLAFLGGMSGLWFLTGFHRPDFHWLGDHWLDVIGIVVAYIVIGAVWGLVKWVFFLHNAADAVQANDASNRLDWKGFPSGESSGVTYQQWLLKNKTPKAANYRDDIMMWMCWWPWSAFWTLLNDPMKRIYRFVYQNMVSIYNRMAVAIFASRFKDVQ